MPGPYFFAWVPAPEPFDAVAHAVEDEAIVALAISQDEGDFASLQITVINPWQGLLAPGRMQWCWLSWDDGITLQPLFHGRLVGVPESVDGETVRLLFSARPLDYENVKRSYAETLRVLPYFDPVWITGDIADPDGALTAYGAVWHIDRTTLALTISDELTGEDGTLSFSAAGHIYDGLSISYSGPPYSGVAVDATLTWKQSGAGRIDLTQRIYQAFKTKKTIYTAPPRSGIIASLTGDGLISSWPKGGASFGGGWTVGQASTAYEVSDNLYPRYNFSVQYYKSEIPEPDTAGRESTLAEPWFESFTLTQVDFPVIPVQQFTFFDWLADRGRTEIARFSVDADIQPLLAEPALEEHIGRISISAADTVTEPDDSGAMPIGDRSRRSYLDTDRGRDSMEYLLLLARAELRRSARAVEVSCRVPWATGVGATLRKNVHLVDYRLPGGHATGKITAYQMSASGEGEHTVEITIGCAIGHGGTIVPAPGEPSYVDDAFVDTGYQIDAGAELAAPTGDLVYQTLTDFPISDDGIDLTRFDETTAVRSLTVSGGLGDQTKIAYAEDPIEALKQIPSEVCIELVPVADMAFETVFTPTVTPLPIPQMIDLEAA